MSCELNTALLLLHIACGVAAYGSLQAAKHEIGQKGVPIIDAMFAFLFGPLAMGIELFVMGKLFSSGWRLWP